MFSLNKKDSNGMIKMRKRNYLFEKKEKIEINKEIKSGGIMSDKFYSDWRGRKKENNSNYPEEMYELNQIIKKFKSNKIEKKGFDYKYMLELTNLLGQRDKNFSKKRLELYNRLHAKKNQYISNDEKYFLTPFNTTYNLQRKQNMQLDAFGRKKPKTFMTYIYGNNKDNNNYYKTYYNKTSINKNFYNKKYTDIYNKTTYNYNSPNKKNSLKNLLTDSTSKSYKRDNTQKKYRNTSNTNNITSSLYLTQYNQNNDDNSFDNTSLVGKEDFLFSGDREKYHEYLKNEYKFFEQPKLIQLKFLLDKQKRIKLFKKIPNYKFLSYIKGDQFKTEVFNRIDREKKNYNLSTPKSIKDNGIKLKLGGTINRKINKKQFLNECENILLNLKKSLSDENII